MDLFVWGIISIVFTFSIFVFFFFLLPRLVTILYPKCETANLLKEGKTRKKIIILGEKYEITLSYLGKDFVIWNNDSIPEMGETIARGKTIKEAIRNAEERIKYYQKGSIKTKIENIEENKKIKELEKEMREFF